MALNASSARIERVRAFGASQLVPAPSKLSPVLAEMSVYEKVSHVEFMQLSLQTRWMIDQKRNEAGLPAIMHGWGSYEEQRALLPSLIQNSLDDFAFLKGRMVDYLTSTTRLEELRGRFKKMDAKRQAEDYQVKHTAKQEEMGRWLGEYFDDAGYEGWEFYPELFKARRPTEPHRRACMGCSCVLASATRGLLRPTHAT